MDHIRTLADLSIRRACGFVGLGIGTVMLALSYDIELAFRSGAVLMSLVCAVVCVVAWRCPRRDVRATELWSMLMADSPPPARGPEAQRLLALAGRILRERLIWHAERIALAAMALWLCTGFAMLQRFLSGG